MGGLTMYTHCQLQGSLQLKIKFTYFFNYRLPSNFKHFLFTLCPLRLCGELYIIAFRTSNFAPYSRSVLIKKLKAFGSIDLPA
jgi:hypothetical protein